jgi:hypothetical protein
MVVIAIMAEVAASTTIIDGNSGITLVPMTSTLKNSIILPYSAKAGRRMSDNVIFELFSVIEKVVVFPSMSTLYSPCNSSSGNVIFIERLLSRELVATSTKSSFVFCLRLML